VILKGLPDDLQVQNARLLRTGESIDLERRDGDIVLTIPEASRDPINTVVVLS
jgi:hypothetical protein